MFQTPIFPSKKIVFSALAIVGLCFCAGDILAQTEKEVIESDNAKPIERTLQENPSSDLESVSSSTPKSKQSISTTSPKNNAALKKSSSLGNEGKKPEASPSTMSFNIFLYIVDKFKED